MVSLLQPLVNIAVAEAGDQYDRMVNFKRELSSLKRIVSLIEGALPEAEEKQVNNPVIRDWLRNLDDICYDARDILDEFVTVAASIRAKRASKRVKSNPLDSISLRVRLSRVKLLRLRFRLANKIKDLRKRLDNMKKDMEIAQLLNFVGGVGCSPNAPKRNRPETGSYPEHQLVGREVEKKMIMEKLLNLKENDVDVVRIWGMGGVGKTALAQFVFNDDRVTKEQNPTIHRKWLFVGEKNFNAKEIIRKITKESDRNDVADNQGKLNNQFIGKRFLIVLDDVWDVGINEWELFHNPLNTTGNCGLIIITTRIEVHIPAICTLVELKPLSNTDCQKIFERYAFTNGHSCSDLEQKKAIGKQIVEKLKGLPLAVKVVGCSLSNEPDLQIWRSFLEADEWRLRSGDDDVIPALRWSYNRLPPHLKQCFTYCSLFPKDYEFDEKMLVKMWMAHGFIQNVEGGGEKRRPEDIGALYFKQLVYASFFQCVEDEYVMHDMIHDLTILVSKEEFLRTNGSRLDDGQLEKVRHISIHPTYFWENLSVCMSNRSTLKRLLTLHTLYDWNSSHIPETSVAHITQNIFKQLKSIRVLVLASCKITYIPECISELIHLRYLDIEKTNVSRIPDTLCDLHNLQTLVAPTDYRIVTVLPENIVNMANLRHLGACLLTCKGVKNLTCLQELRSISVSKGDQISELGDMRHLHGKLTIKCLENVTSEEDAAQAMMQEKTHIDYLQLKFTEGLEDTDTQTKVLDALQCPPNVRSLGIYRYNGLTSPRWMVDGKLIKNLKCLRLSNCHRLVSLPPLGQLNCLKDLWFDHMHAIKKLGEEFYGKQINGKNIFPSLESLDLRFMENLKEWDEIVIEDTSVKFFPCLKTLNISNCPNLVSALPNVKICTTPMNIEDAFRNAANTMGSLYKLYICNCDGLVVLKLGSNLTCTTSVICGIEELIVMCCKKLRSLSFSDRGLNSLQSLTVIECPMLETLFEDVRKQLRSSALRLSSLRTDNRLVVLKMFENDLVSLREMCIGRFPNDEIFNEIVKNNWHKLTLLETLAISRCEDLQLLPPDIHKLSSLRQLWLYDCPELQALPADGFPLSLELLFIAECPLLYERCQVESGTDWHKIKHIPEREIVQTISVGQVIGLSVRLQTDSIFDIVDMIEKF